MGKNASKPNQPISILSGLVLALIPIIYSLQTYSESSFSIFTPLGDLGSLAYLILSIPTFLIGYIFGIVLSKFNPLLPLFFSFAAVGIFALVAFPISGFDFGDLTNPTNPTIQHTVMGRVVEKSWWGMGSTPQSFVSVEFSPLIGSSRVALTDNNGFYSIRISEGSYKVKVVDQKGRTHLFNDGNPVTVKNDLTLNIEWSV